MLHFIKDNRSVIVKMIVNQIGMIFFGLMLSMATNQNNSLFLAASIFSVLFYMFLEYTVGWDLGAHDKIKLDGGRIEYQPYKGLLVSLCANILNILSGLLTVIGYFCIAAADRIPHTIVAYDHSASWAANLYAVPNAVCRSLQPMFMGIVYNFSPYNPIVLAFLPLPIIAISGLGYYFAIKGKSILGMLGIKTKRDSGKH